jgi:hypothetical protein
MTSFFSAWLVKYIIETSATRRARKSRLVRAYRGVYSLVAIIIEAAIVQFIYATQGTVNDPVYFERLRSIHYSHEMIDPVLSRRIPPHDSTDDMADCVNDISAKLHSNDPNLTKIWPNFYVGFKQQIKGYLERDKKEIIEGAISDAISLGDKRTIGAIHNFDIFTEYLLSGYWDHFTPEESINHIYIYLKEAIELAELVCKDADLVKVTFERDKLIDSTIVKP